MVIVQLMASPFYGGPERQVLGLARHLPSSYRTVFVSFAEGGRSQDFLGRADALGFETITLKSNSPWILRATQEISRHLRWLHADVLCCNGYKPDIIGWLAARHAGVPVVSISHGWTGATWRVKGYEILDKLVLPRMDATVCVSAAQAAKVGHCGVSDNKIIVIRNAVLIDASSELNSITATQLRKLFPQPPRFLVGATGRLSPEKGFDQLVEAAALVTKQDPGIGFVIFGDGPLHYELTRLISARNLVGKVVLAGFQADAHRLFSGFNVMASPSFTEGLPVVVLEALAAGVPVVASAVGGIPEIIQDGVHGFLVPPGDPPALARRLLDLAADAAKRHEMGQAGMERVKKEFSFTVQSEHYERLFERLKGSSSMPVSQTSFPNSVWERTTQKSVSS